MDVQTNANPVAIPVKSWLLSQISLKKIIPRNAKLDSIGSVLPEYRVSADYNSVGTPFRSGSEAGKSRELHARTMVKKESEPKFRRNSVPSRLQGWKKMDYMSILSKVHKCAEFCSVQLALL